MGAERRAKPSVDICIIVEGCYPFVTGGVSSWLDWLIKSLPQYSFAIVAISPTSEPAEIVYDMPDNVMIFRKISLHQSASHGSSAQLQPDLDPAQFADSLSRIVETGQLKDFSDVISLLRQDSRITRDSLMNSRVAWETIQIMYDRHMPHGSFLHYFWAWRALFGGLFAMLLAPLPRARVYHTISTGYAGLLAARAAIENQRPALLTEHGIYTNERRIEILMADWIAETMDSGFSIGDDRFDLKKMWVRGFESYGRICYGACSKIVTLYKDNQHLQRILGANEERLEVIPNGIDWMRFSEISRATDEMRPTMALIGRVVPIKDIKTFLYAAAKVRKNIPELRTIIVGPIDEDKGYYNECLSLSTDLGLANCVQFTGRLDITKLLPEIHVNVLSSISEAQPLVLLEAGAAGIPAVATDVGSCRELLLGQPDENPKLGPGGIIADVASSDQIANGAMSLLSSPDLRRRYGESMAERVHQHYNNIDVLKRYTDLYDGCLKQVDGIPWPA
ncbi:MAG: GT4 family glycosyltransferase PelF [Hyphomicrobiaceae bacterium]